MKRPPILHQCFLLTGLLHERSHLLQEHRHEEQRDRLMLTLFSEFQSRHCRILTNRKFLIQIKGIPSSRASGIPNKKPLLSMATNAVGLWALSSSAISKTNSLTRSVFRKRGKMSLKIIPSIGKLGVSLMSSRTLS